MTVDVAVAHVKVTRFWKSHAASQGSGKQMCDLIFFLGGGALPLPKTPVEGFSTQ